MYTDPNTGSLFLQVFAATLVLLTGIKMIVSQKAKPIRVRVRRAIRNDKHENIEK